MGKFRYHRAKGTAYGWRAVWQMLASDGELSIHNGYRWCCTNKLANRWLRRESFVQLTGI